MLEATDIAKITTPSDRGPHAFKVGDRVHVPVGTDVYPGTVVEVKGRKLAVRRDKFHAAEEWIDKMEYHPGGFAGHVSNQSQQSHVITEDPDGGITWFTLRDSGRWVLRGAQYRGASSVRHGWHAFHDYNF